MCLSTLELNPSVKLKHFWVVVPLPQWRWYLLLQGLSINLVPEEGLLHCQQPTTRHISTATRSITNIMQYVLLRAVHESGPCASASQRSTAFEPNAQCQPSRKHGQYGYFA